MPKQYLIDASALIAIGDYLMSRPMREVEGLVAALRQSAPYVPPDPGPAEPVTPPSTMN